MGTVIPEATFLSALGASPYAAEAALPAFFGEGLLGLGASKAAETALPGTIESMKGLSFIDGVPQNFGASMSLLGDNVKTALMSGGDWMKGGKLGLEGLKMMQGEQPPPSSAGQNVQNNVRPQMQSAYQPSFLELIRQNNAKHFSGR
jgi:hypothetical protein